MSKIFVCGHAKKKGLNYGQIIHPLFMTICVFEDNERYSYEKQQHFPTLSYEKRENFEFRRGSDTFYFTICVFENLPM